VFDSTCSYVATAADLDRGPEVLVEGRIIVEHYVRSWRGFVDYTCPFICDASHLFWVAIVLERKD